MGKESKDQELQAEDGLTAEETSEETAKELAEELEEELKDELAAEEAADPLTLMTAERDEYKEKWLRVVAELDNVRKRSSRELVQSRKFAQADVLRGYLEILDNFERALQSAPAAEDNDNSGSFREGVELIYQRVGSLLKDKGVVVISALDAEFDPNVHEAVGTLPREGVESGFVIEVVQQGYHFGDMVLRPARVIISA